MNFTEKRESKVVNFYYHWKRWNAGLKGGIFKVYIVAQHSRNQK